MFILYKLSLKGALTSKSYAFKIRAWELCSLETIDSNDHFNSFIYVQYKNSKIIRVLPKKFKNAASIISDVSRFSFDSLKYNRSPLIKNNNFDYSKNYCNPDTKNILLTSNSIDFSCLNLLKFFQNNSQNILVRSDLFSLRSHALFWNSFNLFAKFDTFSKLCFISSTSLQIESVLLNVKIRLKYSKRQVTIFYCGFFVNSSYSLKFLSLKIKSLFFILKSKNILNFHFFKSFKGITYIVGESLIRRFKDLFIFFNFFKQHIKSCIFYFVTKQNTNLTSMLSPLKSINKRILLRGNRLSLLNLDDTIQIAKIKSGFDFFNCFNSHTTEISKTSTNLFSISSNLESSGIVIDLEGKFKKGNKFPGILASSLAKIVFKCFNFFNFISPIFFNFIFNSQYSFTQTLSNIILESLKDSKKLEEYILTFRLIHSKFKFFRFAVYPTKLIYEDRFRYCLNTKNSLTMLNCSRNYRKESSNF